MPFLKCYWSFEGPFESLSQKNNTGKAADVHSASDVLSGVRYRSLKYRFWRNRLFFGCQHTQYVNKCFSKFEGKTKLSMLFYLLEFNLSKLQPNRLLHVACAGIRKMPYSVKIDILMDYTTWWTTAAETLYVLLFATSFWMDPKPTWNSGNI